MVVAVGVELPDLERWAAEARAELERGWLLILTQHGVVDVELAGYANDVA